MRAVIQRVSQAAVVVDKKTAAEIKKGLLIFLCVCSDDNQKDLEYLAKKIANMRIFTDQNGKFNLSVKDIGGSCIVVSQFTLAADTKKGNRPSFFYAAEPKKAKDFYEKFIAILNDQYRIPTQGGVFAAHMDVSLTNDGPVTIFIDSKINIQ
ncbi:D-aminoacyl-tRNA deacylase [Hippea jasoniae]|uniref:D-aminoacyl-tRNA deacylase n=1 Tax=Hippea jasoniae TaxID=944479 RepID=UPI00054D5278|nr:D-aminoacyl-tRNA deacylase [Hippea jasoniae]